MEIMKECHCLYQNYEAWNSYLNVVPIRNSSIIFQSLKSSSSNLFTQNHCVLVILFLKSTFFKIPFSYPLQRVLCLIFAFFPCQMKFFCILNIISIVLFWSLAINKKCKTLQIAKDLKSVIFHLDSVTYSRFKQALLDKEIQSKERRLRQLKEHTKLYSVNYLCVVIILFITDLYLSLHFLPILFLKTYLFLCCVFCLICFDLEAIFIDFLYNNFLIIISIGTKCYVILVPPKVIMKT